MVLAGIATDLQLSADPHRAIESLALLDALVYFPIVVLEVQRIIVKGAEAQFDMQLSQLHLAKIYLICLNNAQGLYSQ
jgi:uncharacterized membrane protein